MTLRTDSEDPAPTIIDPSTPGSQLLAPSETPPTVITKIGSNALLRGDEGVDHAFLDSIALQVRALMSRGVRVVLVSSGAVASGRSLVDGQRLDIDRHALAAVGQAQLAFDWQAAMREAGLRTAQVLVTEHDFIDRDRCRALRRTLQQLLDHGIVPVVNENDAVSPRGDHLADNDWLAALLAVRLRAHKMMLLTDIDGLYDADPRSNPQAKRLPILPHIDRTIVDAAGGPGAHGTGGMRGKIIAARLASAAGVNVTIAPARADDVISRVFEDQDLGTRVLASSRPRCDFGDLLRMTSMTSGALILDTTAHRQLDGVNDISVAAVRATQGVFDRGDSVVLASPDGFELGRALASLPASEIEQMVDSGESPYHRVVESKKLFLLEPRPELALSA